MSYLNNDLIFKELLKILPNHVFWKDEHGIYQGCNEIFAQGLGFSSGNEIIGKSDYDFPIDKKLSELYRQDDLFVMTSKSPKLNIEEEQIFTNGKKGYLLTNKVPIFDEEKNVVGLLGVYIDITERKIAEEAALRAKEKAEEANRAKTEFLANVSHDVVTPLASLNLLGQIITRNGGEIKPEIGQTISNCANRLLAFLKTFLQSSRVELDAWSLDSSLFSLDELFCDICQLFLPTAITKNIQLLTEIDKTLPKRLYGPYSNLYRVLLNLVGNALKFTEEGSVILRVFRGESIDEENIKVIFEVKDTGIGIPEDKHVIIFEKLQRLMPSYENKVEGSGIGLYIVDQYIKRMGGSIKINSKVGEGSTFIVTVPLKLSR